MAEVKECQEKSISSNTKNTEEVTLIRNKRDLNVDSVLLLDGNGRMLIMWKRQNLFYASEKRMPTSSQSLKVFIKCPLA